MLRIRFWCSVGFLMLLLASVIRPGATSAQARAAASRQGTLLTPLVIGPVGTNRYGHTATLLRDGTVLVAGGRNDSGTPLASAEIFDSRTGLWRVTGSMTTARVRHTAVRNAF